MRWMVAGTLVLLLSGCGEGGEEVSPPPRPPLELEGSAEITVEQRSSTSVPGSGDELLITTDDVTRGQVMTSMAWKDGRMVLPTRSLSEGDQVRFGIEGFIYELSLVRLANALVGEDYATFRIRPLARPLSEKEKIEALIEQLGRLEGAIFIRNGEEHDVEEAVEHMERKWAWKKDDISTAESFIAIAGTGSSTTGKAYSIRLADGSEMTSAAWFRRELGRIEGSLDRPASDATK